MIVKREISKNPKKEAFEFDNGDLQAVESLMNKYHFIDEQAMFRFALVILLRAEKNGVYIDEDDKKVFITPSESIVKTDPAKANPQA